MRQSTSRSIPESDEQTGALAGRERPAEDPVVLLVDDQELVGAALRKRLAAHADIRIHHCRSGLAAVVTACAVAPTVILQDLVMPDADGIELVRAYRATPSLAAIPIVVLSAEAQSSVKSDAFAAGASDYIVKLPDSIELAARIRHHSRAHFDHVEREQAYQALRRSEQQLVAANQELRRLSQVDPLTGLHNRRAFDEYLALEWRRASRQGPLSLLMIDVDEFKRYNDSRGHVAGDEVLRAVGGALRDLLRRPSDLAARYGGEEFVVVLPATELDGAALLAERMRAAVQALALPHPQSRSGAVTISVGVASIAPAIGQPAQQIVEQADGALYEAKRRGRNRVVAGPLAD